MFLSPPPPKRNLRVLAKFTDDKKRIHETEVVAENIKQGIEIAEKKLSGKNIKNCIDARVIRSGQNPKKIQKRTGGISINKK